jgi:hypothetical protein
MQLLFVEADKAVTLLKLIVVLESLLIDAQFAQPSILVHQKFITSVF